MERRHWGAPLLCLAAAAVLGMVSTANAAPRLLERFNDWAAYLNEENGKKLCFVISQPKSTQMNPRGRKRDPGFVFVSFRPSEGVTGEVSFAYGYPLAEDSVRAEIGEDTFSLIARDESAWIEDTSDQPKMVDAMRAGTTMKIFGKSARGTTTVDTYSLSGVTAALKKASEACGA